MIGSVDEKPNVRNYKAIEHHLNISDTCELYIYAYLIWRKWINRESIQITGLHFQLHQIGQIFNLRAILNAHLIHSESWKLVMYLTWCSLNAFIWCSILKSELNSLLLFRSHWSLNYIGRVRLSCEIIETFDVMHSKQTTCTNTNKLIQT